jgi:hypothetical protein
LLLKNFKKLGIGKPKKPKKKSEPRRTSRKPIFFLKKPKTVELPH